MGEKDMCRMLLQYISKEKVLRTVTWWIGGCIGQGLPSGLLVRIE